jgi:hypothetical protein
VIPERGDWKRGGGWERGEESREKGWVRVRGLAGTTLGFRFRRALFE